MTAKTAKASRAASGAAAKTAKAAKRRRRVAPLVVVLMLVGAVALGSVLAFPWQSLRSQRASIDHARDTLARLQAETSHLAEQVADAQDPVVVERIAREQFSLVREGDTLYRLSVDPSDVVTLPATWPLRGMAHLLGR